MAYWFSTRNLEDTDDAYTEGNAVSIAPKVSGYVVERKVDDNTYVRSGDLMVRIDPRDYVTSRDQARANLALARAELASSQNDLAIARVKAPADLNRLRHNSPSPVPARRTPSGIPAPTRVDPRATTQTNVDQANAQLRSNTAPSTRLKLSCRLPVLSRKISESSEDTVAQRQAQVKQAEASLAQAELNLSYTEIRAPQDGTITQRNVDVGTYAQAGQQVFYLVSPDVWVVANFKETQLARMVPSRKSPFAWTLIQT